jgi:MFS transporter, PAT family, beta-lactamase induction signal transducer AmpG
MSAMTGATKRRVPLSAYFEPRARVMLALGFASGLPFYLVGNTFALWLAEAGTSLSAIGFLSWVGLAYSLQFVWAPLLDRVPMLKVLGQRRGWLVASQLVVAAGLLAMATVGTRHGLTVLGACALVVAFASATQDIALAAWRIEIARDADELGLLTAANTMGYQVAVILTGSVLLSAAQHWGWPLSYTICGLGMVVGLIASFLAEEPVQADKVTEALEKERPLWTLRGAFDAVIGPFVAFIKAHGSFALVMLLAISLYRLPDFVRGPVVTPFYHHIGMSNDMIAFARLFVGMPAAFLGMAAGGFFSLRIGRMRALVLAGLCQAVGIGVHAFLALDNGNVPMFLAVMGVDDFSIGFAGIMLVTYMSSLTNLGYTATQYALLSSTYAWPGKVLKGFSGAVVDSLTGPFGQMHAYAVFFVGTGLIGLPAIFLFLWLGALQRPEPGR